MSHTINRVLADLPLVSARALQLGCEVIAVLSSVVLCYRKADNTYITWQVCIQRCDFNTLNYKAVFIDGHYDMTFESGKRSLNERAHWLEVKQVQTFTVWTSAKADGCDTYEQLMAYEKSTGYGYSSQVTTDNIEAIVEAVLNEIDSDLLYHLESA